MKRKLVAMALASVMLALTACGSSSNGGGQTGGTSGGNADNSAQTSDAADAAEAGEKELKVQVGPNPETIDPALNSAVDGANMILHAFETLLVMDESGNLAPGQAESYEMSDDGLTYTFHLRDGLKWSDGTDLTAADFEYSWKRVCDPAVAAPYAETVLSMVEGYEAAIEGDLDALQVVATDDATLTVTLSSPCPYFDYLAGFATLSPVQRATVEANGDAWATSADTYVSNGPFYITDWEVGSHITMSKNPNYWNADAVKLDKLTFALIEDPNASYSAYQNGEVMFIKDVPTEEIPSLAGNAEFHVDPILGTYYLNLNTEKAPFDDPKVREALSLAIDRDYVANTLMQGTYSPATNFVGPGWMDADGKEFMTNANGGTPYLSETADVERAKELLAEAGYPDGEGFPAFTYTSNDAGYHKVVAEYLQQAWGELGLDMSVNMVEWSSFTPMRRNGEYEAARNGWVGDYPDPSNMLDLLYSTNGNNDGKFNNADYDAAMDVSRTTVDKTARFAALHEAEDILMEQAGCVPVAYYNDFYLQSEKITGMWHSAYGYWYFMYADITE